MSTRTILLAMVVFSTPLRSEKPLLTTSSLWDLRTVSDPRITPSGRQVVYVLSWNDRMNDTTYGNLWIVNADGKDARPLTSGPFKDSSPRVSPDGKRVAYLSNRSGKMQIRVRWLDGNEDTQITDVETAPSAIEWSPDGTQIAYQARVTAKPEWTVKMPAQPAGAKWADPPVAVTRLRWRADGVPGVTPPGFTQIFVVPATGGAPRQITSGNFNHGGGFAPGMSWTPDGKLLLFSAVLTADADYELEGGEIYAVSVADGAIKPVTTRKGRDNNPAPSPDGTKIAYTGSDSKFQSYTVSQLYVMDSNGANSRLLTASLDRDVQDPVWSQDGKTIYFLAEDHGETQLYAASLSGEVYPITKGRHRAGAYAAPAGFSMSANGTVALTLSSPHQAGDVFVFSASKPEQRVRVTQSNDSLLAANELGAVEEIRYRSFDGWEMQGWIIKPPHFDASKKYPLILDIHGGPHAAYGVEFQHEFQIQAARGFVVLYTNPRGSTAYGEKFGNVIHTKYPGDDFKDLMAGVDALIAKGYVDSKRMGVTGGSGGGLLTAWTIGQTDRFAAAVSQYPVTDWISQAGTADGGYQHGALWMKSLPWENPQQYMEHSPIFLAKNFKTPTMVLCGEEDWRTPIGQSEELYFALKAQKIPSVLVRFPREPHGIRGAFPSHRIAKMEHVIGWIEKWTGVGQAGVPNAGF